MSWANIGGLGTQISQLASKVGALSDDDGQENDEVAVTATEPVFGQDNPIEPSPLGRRFVPGTTNFNALVRKAAQEQLNPDVLSSMGPFKARVIRVEKQPDSDIGVADWLVGLFDGKKSDAPTMVRIKARVDILDKHIPCHPGPPPNCNWDGNVNGKHQAAIDRHPTYVAQSDLVTEPSVGDMVWVDFGSKKSWPWKDPIYVRPVLEKEGMVKALGIDELRAALAALGCGGGLGVSPATGNSAGGVNRPAGHNGPPKGARSQSVGEPKTIRGEGASEQLAAAWEAASQANNIPMTTWIGTLPSNGNRHLLVFAPLTTDFSKPVELAYVFHGAKSWVPGPAWTGKEGIYGGGVLAKMILDGRNIVIAHPQLPFAGGCKSPCITGGTNGKGGAGSEIFNKQRGGDFTALHGDILNLISQHFSKDAPANISYISITSHSKGVDAVHAAIKHGHLANVKPDKITHADIYGGAYLSHYKQRIYTFEEYVLNKNGLGTDKYVEVNDVTATGKRAGATESGTSAIKFFREYLQTEVGPDTGDKQVTKNSAKYTYNYSPHNLSHGALAAVGIGYVAPTPPLPPGGAATSAVGAFAGAGNLNKVVIMGTSLIGGDANGRGHLGQALEKTVRAFGAQEITVKGVAGSSIDEWLPEPKGNWKDKNCCPVRNAISEGLSVRKMADLNADAYFVAIGGNDFGAGKNETRTAAFIEKAKQVLDMISPEKSKPIIWYGHVYAEEKSEQANNLYRAIDERLKPQYPNLLVQWPKTEALRQVYLSPAGGDKSSRHPSETVHQAFVDAGKADLMAFLGLGGGAAQTAPDDNANASPTREVIPADGDGPGVGPKAGDERLLEIVEIVDEALDGYTTDDDWTNLARALFSLNQNGENIFNFKALYSELQFRKWSTAKDISTVLAEESLSNEHQTAMYRDAINLLTPLPDDPANPPFSSDGGGDAKPFSPDGDDKTPPSERPESNSTEEPTGVQPAAGPTVKYLDLVRSESQRIGIEFETALGFIKAESGGKTMCAHNGKMLVRFEPHIFINHGIKGNRGKGYGLKGRKDLQEQVPWKGCKGSKCSQWLNLGYTHVSNCTDPHPGNWETEVVKNIGGAIKVAQDLGLDPDLPYVAASFGTGQVMGFNHRFTGYPSAKAMFDDWSTNEVAQIKGIFSYFEKKPGMLAAVKGKDWDKMARLYNGCGDGCTSADGTRGYGPKLAAAYNHFKAGNLPPNRELNGTGTGTGGASAGGAISAGTSGAGCAAGGIGSSGGVSTSAGGGSAQYGGKVVQGEFPPNPDGLYPGQPPAIAPVIKGGWAAVYGTPGTNSHKTTLIDFQHNDRQRAPKMTGKIKRDGCRVATAAAKAFMMASNEIEQLRKTNPEVAAYQFYRTGQPGCATQIIRCKHNSKHVKGEKPPNCTSGISLHSYGIAMDINPSANPFTKGSSRGNKFVPGGWKKGDLVTDIPKLIVGAFKRYGFGWGGDWNGSKDAMHFEFRGDPKALDAAFVEAGGSEPVASSNPDAPVSGGESASNTPANGGESSSEPPTSTEDNAPSSDCDPNVQSCA